MSSAPSIAAALAGLGAGAAAGEDRASLDLNTLRALHTIFGASLLRVVRSHRDDGDHELYSKTGQPPGADPPVELDAGSYSRYRVEVSEGPSADQLACCDVVSSMCSLWGDRLAARSWNEFAGRAVNELRCRSPHEPIDERLSCLAALVMEAPCARGVRGALVTALDGQRKPIAFGASSLSLADPQSPLATVRDLVAGLGDVTGPCDVPADRIKSPPGTVLRGYPLVQATGHPWAGFLVAAIDPVGRSTADPLLGALAHLLSLAIRDALGGELARRVSALSALIEKLDIRQIDLGLVVNRLREIFRADAVSLFLDDQGVLRLAATTDARAATESQLTSVGVVGGITGYVFGASEAVRFFDDREAAAFREAKVPSSRRARKGGSAGTSTVRLMAVPMRHGSSTVGVLRMSRGSEALHFTEGEEDALCLFGDVLGGFVSEHWVRAQMRRIHALSVESVYLARLDEGTSVRAPIVHAFPGAEHVYGISQAELLKKDALTLYPEARRELQEMILSHAREKGPFETMARSGEGFRPVEVSFRLVENDLFRPPGRFLLAVARDISERRKRTEENERLRDFLDHVGIAYFHSDASGRTVHTTPLDSALTGYSREHLETHSRDLLYSDPRERSRLLAEVRAAGGQLLKRIVQMKRKGGSPLVAEADLRLLTDDSGAEVGLEGFYREVTDRIHLQGFLDADMSRVLDDAEVFRRLKAQAEFQQDYLMSLGHQLKTPLLALVETARNIQRRITKSENVAERMGYVIGQTLVCIGLVTNLSYLGKILRNDPIEATEVDLEHLIFLVRSDFTHLLREKKLSFAIDDVSLREHARVKGDRDLLRQVFVNLVDNAVKYSLPETRIFICARSSRAGPVVDVSNEGLKISVDERTKVFERGFRSPPAEAVVPHGTGLGLWLVRRMLQAHRAEIECLTETGLTGRPRNVFRITFPRLS